MIRGMSYYRGIFFMNNKGISHATIKNGKIITHYHPMSFRAILFLFSRLLFAVPLYFLLLGIVLIILIEQPSIIYSNMAFTNQIPKVPLYIYILFLFSYHFMFPLQLKKYHGAEHKVFSYRGKKHLANATEIQSADIVNRYCSTNTVVFFFCFFILSFPFVNGWIATLIGFLAIILIPRFWKWGDRHIFFPISSYLQKIITTSTPNEHHMKVAILSYMSLQAEHALSEDEVWLKYYEEIEAKRLASIHRLIEDEERQQALYEQQRNSLLIHYVANMVQDENESNQNEKIYSAI